MGINRSLSALHPDLVRVYEATLPKYKAAYPGGLVVSLNETSRSKAVQDAYFSRSRFPVLEVQRLYRLAGLYAIDKDEAKQKNTNARYGGSAHNFDPSRAFDIELTDAKGRYVDSPETCRAFWLLYKAEADALGIPVTWGGTWKDWPHIELTNWRTLK